MSGQENRDRLLNLVKGGNGITGAYVEIIRDKSGTVYYAPKFGNGSLDDFNVLVGERLAKEMAFGIESDIYVKEDGTKRTEEEIEALLETIPVYDFGKITKE